MSFDWKYYISRYPDLQQAGITTKEKAISHWNNIGKTEGRVCTSPTKPVNLIYYKCKIGAGNFGDELSVFITSSLLNKTKYTLVLNEPDIPTNIVCIGSYIQSAKDKSYIYGSGIRINSPSALNNHKYKSLHVHAVRGPLTKQVLESRGIVCPPIFGDPALLLPRFYTPNILKELGDKIGIIPHYTQITYYRDNLIGRNQFHIIDPTMHWKTVIDNICSCKYIVSSSLHGLICSDAYGKPNIWLNNIKLDEGDFKFRDYFLSQERPYYYTQKVTLEDESKLYSGGNKIDLDKLHDAFPFL